jgi:hypothetical protein
MILNYFRLRNAMLTILKEAINVGLKLCSTSVTWTFNLLFDLIQVCYWTVSTDLSVFTGLENVRFEPTNRRSRTSDQQIF